MLLTFSIAVFVLLMQFVWKYIDDMVGKGLSVGTIAELLFYASATFVPMALPIAVLFASIMTMGNFGEKYELVAMKAGGISLRRVMLPMVMVVLVLTGVAFYFANNVLPAATLKYRVTLYDVTRKKPALNIRPSEYYSEIDGYVIRVNEKDQETGRLYDIIVYDHTKSPYQTNVILAESGMMQTSPDNNYLIFTLYDGHTYSESTEGEDHQRRPLTSIDFKEQVLTFDLSSFAFDKSDEEGFKTNCQMMNVVQLDTTSRHLRSEMDQRYAEFRETTTEKLGLYHRYNKIYADADALRKSPKYKPIRMNFAPSDDGNLFNSPAIRKQGTKNRAKTIANQVHDDFRVYTQVMKSDSEYLNRHYVVWNRKYTFSLACLVLFLIGAPFGSIVRKGGLGLPLVASVGFFVLYYVIDMIDEKAVRGSAMDPVGMWVATFVFLPIGIFLTIHATTDAPLLDSTKWSRFFSRFHHKKSE